MIQRKQKHLGEEWQREGDKCDGSECQYRPGEDLLPGTDERENVAKGRGAKNMSNMGRRSGNRAQGGRALGRSDRVRRRVHYPFTREIRTLVSP